MWWVLFSRPSIYVCEQNNSKSIAQTITKLYREMNIVRILSWFILPTQAPNFTEWRMEWSVAAGGQGCNPLNDLFFILYVLSYKLCCLYLCWCHCIIVKQHLFLPAFSALSKDNHNVLMTLTQLTHYNVSGQQSVERRGCWADWRCRYKLKSCSRHWLNP